MKIGGKQIDSAPASEILVFPRGDGHIGFRATALLDRKEFEKLCPLPKIPQMRGKGGLLVDNPDDPRYGKAFTRHNKNYIDYLLIAGLTVLPEKEGEPDLPIEWEKVKLSDRNTWHLWEEELMESGFSDMERKRIANLVASVNTLTENRLDEARKTFLQLQRAEPEDLSYQTDELNDTLYGEPANDSESGPQESLEVGTSST